MKKVTKIFQSTKMYNFIKKYKKQLMIACFAFIGTATLLISQAATYSANVEPELGNISSPAKSVSVVNASGGTAIKFGVTGPGPGGWPSSTANKVCGNSAILDGPTSAPAGLDLSSYLEQVPITVEQLMVSALFLHPITPVRLQMQCVLPALARMVHRVGISELVLPLQFRTV